MRLEMGRIVGLAATFPALLLSASCCCKAPYLIGDVVSGGPDGYAFVKVVITLSGDATECHVVDVQPPTVHVFPGSAIRWRVNNLCDVTTTVPPRRLKFTKAVPGAHGKSGAVAATPATQMSGERAGGQEAFSFKNCVSEFGLGSQVGLGAQKDPRNVLLCEIPDDVIPGFYKYGLEGDIKTYDPGLEVHGGGK